MLIVNRMVQNMPNVKISLKFHFNIKLYNDMIIANTVIEVSLCLAIKKNTLVLIKSRFTSNSLYKPISVGEMDPDIIKNG